MKAEKLTGNRYRIGAALLSAGSLLLSASGCGGGEWSAGVTQWLSPRALRGFTCAHKNQPPVTIDNILEGSSLSVPDSDDTMTATGAGQFSVEHLTLSSDVTIVHGNFDEVDLGSSLAAVKQVILTSRGAGSHELADASVNASTDSPTDYITGQAGQHPGTTKITISCHP